MGIRSDNAFHVSRKICDQLHATLVSLYDHPFLRSRDLTQPEQFENFCAELRGGVEQFVNLLTLLKAIRRLPRTDVERPLEILMTRLVFELHNAGPLLIGHEQYLSKVIVPRVKNNLRVLADETEFWDSLDACVSDSQKRLAREREQSGQLACYAKSSV
jgi:hypothetical protein